VVIILGYIAAVVVLIIAVIFSRIYMRKHRKEFVNGATPNFPKRSFVGNHPALFILVLTPILFAIAWFIGWMYSR
jgi:cell division protein FtsX